MATKDFIPEAIRRLNELQQSGRVHPYTCGNPNKNKDNHPDGSGEGVLIATTEGWKCPYCDYTQDWFHA